jgi:vacuolar iron transporter family protein
MKHHSETHRVHRLGWLRAAVLGANDGLISTSSLIVGMAAAHAASQDVLVAGLAGLVGGSLSMAAGEYVSVSSQADTESADLARERRELATTPEAEHRELAGIYVSRGLTPELADQVALTSATSFALGAAMPLLLALLVPAGRAAVMIFCGTLVLLLALGAWAAYLGGARLLTGALRVGFWGASAMAATGIVGHLFGVRL